eukprot:3008200-Prymnesium_polylepis.2
MPHLAHGRRRAGQTCWRVTTLSTHCPHEVQRADPHTKPIRTPITSVPACSERHTSDPGRNPQRASPSRG